MLISRSPRFRCTSAALASPSSRGLGHRPFTAVTGVRIPLGTPHTLDFMVQFWSSPCFPNSRFDGKYSGIFRGDRETAADINALQANYRGIANGNFGTPNRELFPPTQELFASRRELPGIIKSARFRRPSRPRRHPIPAPSPSQTCRQSDRLLNHGRFSRRSGCCHRTSPIGQFCGYRVAGRYSDAPYGSAWRKGEYSARASILRSTISRSRARNCATARRNPESGIQCAL